MTKPKRSYAPPNVESSGKDSKLVARLKGQSAFPESEIRTQIDEAYKYNEATGQYEWLEEQLVESLKEIWVSSDGE